MAATRSKPEGNPLPTRSLSHWPKLAPAYPWGWAKPALHEVLLKSRPWRLSAARGSQTMRNHSGDALVPRRINHCRNPFRDERDPQSSPIDPQAVNGCRRKSDKAHSGIFDAVASARATPLIFGRQIDVVKPVPESPLLCLKQLRGDHLLDRLTRGTVFKQLGYSHR
jgi:hypothetical protein